MGSWSNKRIVVILMILVVFLHESNAQVKVQGQQPSDINVTHIKPEELAWADSITITTKKVQTLVGKGEVGGFISMDQFWRLHHLLQKRLPKIVGTPFSIGKTFKGEEIKAFFLGFHEGDEDKKDIILFDALHHARELVTLSMIVRILEDQVSSIVRKSKKTLDFYMSNRLLIVPVVNLDTFNLICQSYGKTEWENIKWMRKNQNGVHINCNGYHQFGGVDLNRNYPVHFGQGNPEEGSSNDKCNEEYRGEKPFSEPETQAVKNLIERYDRIVSAMNFHAYGDLWIYPANFQSDKGPNVLRTLNHDLWRKYKMFEKNTTWSKNDRVGNAMKTISYFAQGEAADWMAVSKGIFAFSPELGTNEEDTNTFYPQPSSQIKIIDQNFKIVKSFLNFHIPTFNLVKRSKNSIVIELASVFPIRDISIKVMNQRARAILLNGRDITTDTSDLGIRFGDKIEIRFFQDFQASLIKKNWIKNIKKGWKRFVRVIIGRNVNENFNNYSWTKFKNLATIGVFF